jgi:hypothetical protein
MPSCDACCSKFDEGQKQFSKLNFAGLHKAIDLTGRSEKRLAPFSGVGHKLVV